MTTTPNRSAAVFPPLLTAEEAIAQEETEAAARKAAADAAHWRRVALALRVIEEAGYTSMAERLLDDDENAYECRRAVEQAVVRGIEPSRIPEADREVAERTVETAVKGIVKARTNTTARRRITNLLAHGSPDEARS